MKQDNATKMVKMFEEIQQKYNTIVIDPPWQISMAGIKNVRPNQRKALPYNTMSLEEIKQLPIDKIANSGSHIYLWTTNKMLKERFDVFDRWNVKFHIVVVWVKPSAIAPMFAYQFATEFCLLGFYDKKKPMQKFLGKVRPNWIKDINKHNNHSKKPDGFYTLVEEMSPAPRIDIFARRQRQGWDVWGNEVKQVIL